MGSHGRWPKRGGGIVEEILAIFIEHRGKILCGLGGFLFGWLLITRGLAATLLLCLCVALGYFVGKKVDAGGKLEDVLKHFLASYRR